MRRKLLELATAAALSLPAAHLAVAGQDCISDWSVAAPLVQREQLVTVEALAALAKARIAGDIVKASLCAGNDGWSYRLVVRERNGKLKMLSLDARHPFGR